MRHVLLLVVGYLLAAWTVARASSEPILRFETDPAKPAIPFLSWDTEGGQRCERNLLRANSAVSLRLLVAGGWQTAASIPFEMKRIKNGSRYEAPLDQKRIAVEFRGTASQIEMTFAADAEITAELSFPFDPRVTPTTVIPGDWTADGRFTLPAVVNAPDFGPMFLTATGKPSQTTTQPAGLPVRGRLEGSRAEKRVDLTLEFQIAREPLRLTLSPLLLPVPKGLKDDGMLWPTTRRGWLNAIQPCAKWGEQNRPFSAPAGMLGNNVISDPASCSLWFYADQVFWMPQIAPGVSAATSLRRTVDWWLDEKTRPDGEVICYWNYGGFLDANAGPVIAAWDYVECTGDQKWLRGRLERIEFVADFLARRDIDGDGMIEAVQSGNLGTLVQPNRSCAWWDALNCGHKDGYTNAVIYRAFRCLADMEHKLGREDRARHFTNLADRLKASYARTLWNPATGWLAWWKSADGELHDYASPTLNGIAIEYGLVEPGQGRQILEKLWAKMDAVGFKQLELGVPPMLVPVRRGDYLQPNAIGLPQKEDGTDTFGQYMNGGITAGHALHFLDAHYVVGWDAPAERMLRLMLLRQYRGEFQNGVTDAAMQGMDWTTWDGRPCGYEGYLADSFRFLQAVLIREPAMRDRLYRPLRLSCTHPDPGHTEEQK